MKAEMVILSVALPVCIILSACDRTPAKSAPTRLAALLEMAPANLAAVDIARMNLLCAQGLGGADCVDLDAAGAQLDAWAERVRSETARHRYRFNRRVCPKSRGFPRVGIRRTLWGARGGELFTQPIAEKLLITRFGRHSSCSPPSVEPLLASRRLSAAPWVSLSS